MNPASDRIVQSSLSRRDVVVRLGGGGLTALVLAATRSQTAPAQEATYPPTTGAVGVFMQVMGSGQPMTAPGLELTLRRTTLVLGGRLLAHSHPGALVIFVEAGQFGYTHLGGEVRMTRTAADGTPSPAEGMPAGEEVILHPGDWLFVHDPQDDIRNAGDEDVVLLVAGLTRAGEPFTTFLDEMDTEMDATPAG